MSNHVHTKAGPADILTLASGSVATETCKCGAKRTFKFSWSARVRAPGDAVWTEWSDPKV